MADEKHNDDRSLLDKLIAILPGLPWLEMLGYEVLEYESTLELKDRGGNKLA